jgi:hypothetical protein
MLNQSWSTLLFLDNALFGYSCSRLLFLIYARDASHAKKALANDTPSHLLPQVLSQAGRGDKMTDNVCSM